MCYFEFICGNWCFSFLIKTWVDVQCNGLLFFSIAYLHSMCKQFHSFGSAALGVFSTEDANTRQCFWLFPTCSYCLMMLQYPWHLDPLDLWLAVLSLSRIINLFTSLGVFNPKADLDTLYVTQAWKKLIL